MTAKEIADERWARSIGIILHDEPQPMVSGERYARLVEQNDQPTTKVHLLASENEFLRAQIVGVQQRHPVFCNCATCRPRKCRPLGTSPESERPIRTWLIVAVAILAAGFTRLVVWLSR